MLARSIKRVVSLVPRFYFGGGHGHGHHEVNKDKITLRNEASGTVILKKDTSWIQLKLADKSSD